MMTMHPYSTIYPEGVMYATVEHSVDMRFLEDDYCMIKLNGRRRHGSVKLLRDEAIVACAAESLHMFYAVRPSGEHISLVHYVIVCRIAIKWTVTAQRETVLTDMMHNLRSYL